MLPLLSDANVPLLRIAHLYPKQLNLYGDRGNVLTLVQRMRWRGWQAELREVNLGDAIDPDWADIYLMGGGQDRQQLWVADDLHRVKAPGLKIAALQQAVFLGICGGYQLFGHYYRPHQGDELRGLSLLDVTTQASHTRLIGNITLKRHEHTLVGFENHSGLTQLGADASPLGHVLTGGGNNGQDGTEGAVQGHVYGTYLHGSLLPKNPELADELIGLALQRRFGVVALPPLDDATEHAAHAAVAYA
jgi:lipid II isoglutaminyl synthase (glutamine-hydrolysing)